MKPAASMFGLSPLARKGAVIVLASFAGLVLLALLPFLWLGGLREQAHAAKSEYELVKARAARLADAKQVRLTAADEPGRMFLPGETAGTTLAAFQSIVNATALGSGLSIVRVQPLPTEPAKGVTPYRLAVDATGSLEQLRAFLAEIESAIPLVFVTGFEIKPETAADAAEQPYPSEKLSLTLRLEAYGYGGAQ